MQHTMPNPALRWSWSASLALLPSLSALFTLPSAGHAETLIDDDGGPGVDYTDIQPAVDAAGFQAVICVRPGSYTGFTVSRGLTILGEDSQHVHVPGVTRVAGVGARVVLANLNLGQLLELRDCTGTVVLEAVRTAADLSAQPVLIENCSDVRLHEVSPSAGVLARNARVELANSSFQGLLHADDASRIHVSRSSLVVNPRT